MKTILIFLAFLTTNVFLYGQERSVAFTMDDLLLAFDGMDIEDIESASDSLLNSITKYSMPVTVFVNEKSFTKDGETDRRFAIYNKWINNPLITIGNHTYSHKNYADTPLVSFQEDIILGEDITKYLLKKVKKDLKYFRFPFNCTGKDSISRAEIFDFLNDRGYVITPFTIESADYMYNLLYSNYIKKGDIGKAEEIIEKYIDFTVDLFKYFETVSHELYGRNIRHIYLCHTNRLNAACFERLIIRLKETGYGFISLDEAMQDSVYKSKDYYTKKFGVSWIYRWIENSEERIKLMRKEPYAQDIEDLYNSLIAGQ